MFRERVRLVRDDFADHERAGRLGHERGELAVVARLAWPDFSDPDLPPTPGGLRAGGRLTTITLGVNWYLSDRARVMLNYLHVVPTNVNAGSGTADSVTVRTAVSW